MAAFDAAWQAERSAYITALSDTLRAAIAARRTRATYRDGSAVRLLSVSRAGVRVRFPSGAVHVVHPEDVKVA